MGNHTTPPNVLLADDDKDDCLFFKDALEEALPGAELKVVYNGDELMQWLMKEAIELPDVIFLDLNMPRKNGFACMEEINANKKLNSLPVIIMSTSYDESVANRLYKNGAYYYISKPVNFNGLQLVIEQAIHLILNVNVSRPARENFFLNNISKVDNK